ncbi:MAG: hypothetical protein JWN07_3371 [Hyphomicrobiales bacterium]|nr:hypothetical protein [Hyphomicrobiales bacterium]
MGGHDLGAFLALLAATTFALNNAFARRGVLNGTVLQAMAISVPLGVPLFLIATLATGSTALVLEFSGNAWVLLSVAGIVHFVLGRYCNYRAVKAMGANLAGPLMEASVLVALALAVLLLGEHLTLIKAVGILLILGGPALIVARRSKKDAKPQNLAFAPIYFEGTLFALLAALAYGTSPILVRFALEKVSWQASIAGGLVSYVAATVVTVVFVLAAGQTQHVRNMPGDTIKWFCWAGVFVGLSQMLRYMALSLAPVSVVSPIQRLSLIFRLVFSYMLNRKYEVFNSRMVLGTIVSIVGAVLLSVSIDDVRLLLPIPEALAPAFTWTWP